MSKSAADWLFENAPVHVLDYVVELVKASREQRPCSGVDWDNLPEWANWYAVDNCGYISVFEQKPSKGKAVWHDNGGQWNYVYPLEENDTPDWQNSLQQRPKKSLVNWDEMPDWAQWAAVDVDGGIWVYEYEPEINLSKGAFYNVSDTGKGRQIDVTLKIGNWQNSLEKRP